MPYWEKKSPTSNKSMDNYSTAISGPANPPEFYELEPAVVLDVIIDKNHEIFKKGKTIGEEPWAPDLNGQAALKTDVDYTWIGRVLVRPVTSGKQISKEKLVWAIPMESNLSEYPLVNELVIVGKYFGKYYYSKKLNHSNLVNHNTDFSKEPYLGGGENTELGTSDLYQGPLSKTTLQSGFGEKGVAGRYFWVNKNIRALRRHEGDLIVESRFGQSIKFAGYDDERKNDSGLKKNKDYYGPANGASKNPVSQEMSGGGNPMLIIRNRQRPLLKNGETLILAHSPNPGTIRGTSEEKNVGGYVSEDINHDGSSIHITSGQTISSWVTTCYKKMFGLGEEVKEFSGITTFTYPTLDGDQIVINSDRLVLSARYGEQFHYSKKRYAIVTDNEYTVDAHQQVVITTNTKAVINAPAIYLGEYNQTNEPVLLGQTSVNWLYDLCDWLKAHTHWYIHSHVDAGEQSPSQTQLPVQIQQLIALQNRLEKLLSRRVFVTGGGLAPGQNGGSITDGTAPTNINTTTGAGVPGGWKGANKR